MQRTTSMTRRPSSRVMVTRVARFVVLLFAMNTALVGTLSNTMAIHADPVALPHLAPRPQRPVSSQRTQSITYTLAERWSVDPNPARPIDALCNSDGWEFASFKGMEFDRHNQLRVAVDCRYAFTGSVLGQVATIFPMSNTIETRHLGVRRQGQLYFIDGYSARRDSLLHLGLWLDARWIGENRLGSESDHQEWDAFGDPRALSYGPNDAAYAYGPEGVAVYGPGRLRQRRWPPITADGDWLQPGDIVIDTEGRVYLTDGGRPHGIHRFLGDGSPDPSWQPDGGLPNVRAISGYADDDVLYAFEHDGTTPRVRVYRRDGSVAATRPASDLLLPTGEAWLTVRPDGRYAIAGSTSAHYDMIFLHAPDGTLERTLVFRFRRPSPDSSFSTTSRIASSDPSRVAVLDIGRYEVFVYGPGGVEQARWSAPVGSSDIALDHRDDVFLRSEIPGSGMSRVQRRSLDGQVVWESRLPSRSTEGLDVSEHYVFAARTFGGEVHVLQAETGEPAGTLRLASEDDPFLPYDLTVLGSDGLAALDHDREHLHVWDLGRSTLYPRVSVSADPTTNAMAHLSIDGTGSGLLAALVGVYEGSARATRWRSELNATHIQVLSQDARRLWEADLANMGLDGVHPNDIAAGNDGTVFTLLRDPVSRTLLVARLDPEGSASGEPLVPTPTPPSPPTADDGGLCVVEGDKTAHPSEIWLGESVTVTLTLRRRCPMPAPKPADIVLVVDTTGSMTGIPAQQAGAAVKAFVEGLDLAQHRVGVVTFGTRATVALPLTNDPETLANLPDDWGAEGATNVHAGATTAFAHLQAARPGADRVAIILTDGRYNQGASPLAPCVVAQRDGVIIHTVGLGALDVRLLIGMAGSIDRFHDAPGPERLPELYRRIADGLNAPLGGGTLVDRVYPDVVLRDRTIVPPPFGLPGADILWSWPTLDESTIRLTYQVRPKRTGWVPTNTFAYLDYADVDGTTRRYVYPEPTVLVKAPVTPSATPTARPPTPTLRPPSPTPVTPVAIYLPILLREAPCKPGRLPVDVVLLMDASTSMLEHTSQGRRKVDAAVDAARVFLDLLRLESGDRAAVVAFNHDARMSQSLTANRSLLADALDGIVIDRQTCLVCALDASLAAFPPAAEREGRLSAMILLTDGRSNPRPASEAVDSATVAKAADIVLFTVGLGAELDFDALRDIASKPDYFIQAPDGEDLEAIYRDIAVELPCPADRYWGRR